MGWEEKFRKAALIVFAAFLVADFFFAGGSIGNFFLGVALGGILGLVIYTVLLFFITLLVSIRFIVFYRSITAEVADSLLKFVYVNRFGRKRVQTIIDLSQVDYMLINQSRRLKGAQLEFWKNDPEPYFSYQNLVPRNLDAVKMGSVLAKSVQDVPSLHCSLTNILTNFYGEHDFAPLVDKDNWQSLIEVPALDPYDR